MDNIEQIPADKPLKMTALYHRLFVVGGCTPACHHCKKWIPVGDDFKLATVNMTTAMRKNSSNIIKGSGSIETKEVMLCNTCTSEDFNKMTAELVAEYGKWQKETGGGCFRVNGKIVH